MNDRSKRTGSQRTTRLIGRPPTLLASVCALWTALSFGADGGSVGRIVKDKPAAGLSVHTPDGYMVPYTARIPGTEIMFEMVPVPGGRAAGSAKQFGPFWIGRHEVTWREYARYMKLRDVFRELERRQQRLVNDDTRIDAVTAPTEVYAPYERFQFARGPKCPASSMSRYAARQYTKWLSRITGHQYRLPTEQEWEYACRAGRSTAWSFGDDPSMAGEYCVYAGNSDDEGPRVVGSRKPNAWGIHDMHGNVAEWVLVEDLLRDHRRLDGQQAGRDAEDKALHSMVLKGGGWDRNLKACRADARRHGDADLWVYDADVPRSPWWLASDDGAGIGFRIVSPLQKQSRDDMEKYWRPDSWVVHSDATIRVEEGRGVFGLVDRQLPDVVKRLGKTASGQRPPWDYQSN